MSITAAMVKELRERTGAGMMECKKALQETGGDIEGAIEAMRKRGQAKAAKRAGHIAAEGIIMIKGSDDNKQAAIIELNSETDFVARDASFKAFANLVATRALQTKSNSAEELLKQAANEGEAKTLEEARQELVSKIGENVQLRRVDWVEATGIVGSYLHGERIGVLVAMDKPEEGLARDLAMHIAATNPQAIDESDMPEELVNKEREIFMAQAKESGKSEEIINKMVEGRVAKFLKEVCLVGQPFIKDTEQNIAGLLRSANNAKVTKFVRYEVGEGIEKKTVDFAEEVKAQVQGS